MVKKLNHKCFNGQHNFFVHFENNEVFEVTGTKFSYLLKTWDLKSAYDVLRSRSEENNFSIELLTQ